MGSSKVRQGNLYSQGKVGPGIVVYCGVRYSTVRHGMDGQSKARKLYSCGKVGLGGVWYCKVG